MTIEVLLKNVKSGSYHIHFYIFFASYLFPVPCSLFPVPCSIFPVLYSLFYIPCSIFPKISNISQLRPLFALDDPDRHTALFTQVDHQFSLLGIRSPRFTYHLPPTTYHLPPTTYHLPPTTYHLPPRFLTVVYSYKNCCKSYCYM